MVGREGAWIVVISAEGWGFGVASCVAVGEQQEEGLLALSFWVGSIMRALISLEHFHCVHDGEQNIA